MTKLIINHLMFNQALIERKQKEQKPYFYCTSKRHFNSRHHIPYDNIQKCTMPDCFCGQLNGWVATCEGCGTVIHNCLWGCGNRGIPVLVTRRKAWAKGVEGADLRLHQQVYHIGHPLTLEF